MFGGGGHHQAAGFRVQSGDFTKTTDFVIGKIKDYQANRLNIVEDFEGEENAETVQSPESVLMPKYTPAVEEKIEDVENPEVEEKMEPAAEQPQTSEPQSAEPEKQEDTDKSEAKKRGRKPKKDSDKKEEENSPDEEKGPDEPGARYRFEE